MSDTPLFSVVIPNWNGLKFLKTCLDALRAQTYPNIEVIIADNASTDGSQDFIRTHYPEVILIDMGYNSGFTGACNAGMKHAKGDVIALLNNDTEVDRHWAEAVMDAFARHPNIGTVASKMLLFDKRDHIHTTGDYFTVDGRAGNRGVWERDEGQYDHEELVFSACGGSSAYRREMLDQIGLLDDDYFFSLEDVDLGWRAQLAGWQCLYTPRAIVYHHLSATGGGVTASFYDGRNSIFVLYKNYPKALWRKYRGAIIKQQWRKAWEAIRAWRGKASRAKLRGMLAGIVALPKWRKKRIAIQNSRVISIDALEAILTKLEK
jgi:GT2 family glycosyltransferase